MKALLVIDMQKEYIDKYENTLISRINKRIQEARENKEFIIYVKNLRKLRSGVTSYDFADELVVCSENVVYKDRASLFSNDSFLKMLKDNNISHLTIIGIDGCCCVASSASDARKFGYAVTIPFAYIGIKNPERFEKKKAVLKKYGVTIEELAGNL